MRDVKFGVLEQRRETRDVKFGALEQRREMS